MYLARRVVFFLAVCAATFAVMNQFTGRRTAAVSVAATTTTATTDEDRQPMTPDGASAVALGGLRADGSLSAVGLIPIRGTLAFYDNTTDQTLTWHLVVTAIDPGPDGSYPVAWERSYDDQAFTVPAGVDASPGFAEDVGLPPGTYLARLSVRENRDGSPCEIAGAGAVVYLSP